MHTVHHLRMLSRQHYVCRRVHPQHELRADLRRMVGRDKQASTASLSDPAGGRLVLKKLRGLGAGKRLSRVWVDSIYRGTLLDWGKACCKYVLEPVLRMADMNGFMMLPKRWVVERTSSWLGKCRRLSKDYEKPPKSSEAIIYIAMTRLMFVAG
ncbi:MAG: transposase [Chloroflexia bacterium]